MKKVLPNKRFIARDETPKINPTFEWVIKNAPQPKHEGIFYSYAYVFEQAYGYVGENMGNQVRFDLEENIKDLFNFHSTAVQLSVKCHGKRGIRVFNMR